MYISSQIYFILHKYKMNGFDFMIIFRYIKTKCSTNIDFHLICESCQFPPWSLRIWSTL